MRSLFFGTPAIAVPALEALHEVSHVQGVVCQPDRPAGRGLAVRPPPVKERALSLGLEVVQPTKLRRGDFPAWLAERDADVAVVMAYGRILPQSLLDLPRRGCLNLHASLLPKYRGAAPINWAIVEGETETGISLMQMDAGMDTGPVLAMRAIPIDADMTAGALADALASLAATVVRELLAAAVAGELEPAAQDHARATAARMLSKDDGRIDWTLPAKRVHDHARGMTPWPGAHTTVDARRLLVLETRLHDDELVAPPGQVLTIDDTGARVACGRGSVRVVRAQVAGRRPLHAQQLAAGRALAVGTVLGAP